MIDYMMDETGDMLLDDNGGYILGESTGQHQQLLLICQKGEFKENPDACVGIEDYLNGTDINGMVAEIRSQFTKDGMTVKQLRYDEQTGELTYDANYTG